MDKDFVNYLDKKFNSIDEKFNQIDKKVDSKFGEVLDGQDKIVNQLDSLKQEGIVSTELYQKHETEIQDHKKRILSLEAK